MAKDSLIIFDTTMCKGVPFLEAREITHFVRVEPEEWGQALAVLDLETYLIHAQDSLDIDAIADRVADLRRARNSEG